MKRKNFGVDPLRSKIHVFLDEGPNSGTAVFLRHEETGMLRCTRPGGRDSNFSLENKQLRINQKALAEYEVQYRFVGATGRVRVNYTYHSNSI